MSDVWSAEITISSLGTSYAALASLSGAPTRGDVLTISGRRVGSGGTGTVTVRIFEDSSSEDLVCEAQLDLGSDGAVDVVGDLIPLPFASSDLQITAKDDSASGDSVVIIVRGRRGIAA